MFTARYELNFLMQFRLLFFLKYLTNVATPYSACRRWYLVMILHTTALINSPIVCKMQLSYYQLCFVIPVLVRVEVSESVR